MKRAGHLSARGGPSRPASGVLTRNAVVVGGSLAVAALFFATPAVVAGTGSRPGASDIQAAQTEAKVVARPGNGSGGGSGGGPGNGAGAGSGGSAGDGAGSGRAGSGSGWAGGDGAGSGWAAGDAGSAPAAGSSGAGGQAAGPEGAGSPGAGPGRVVIPAPVSGTGTNPPAAAPTPPAGGGRATAQINCTKEVLSEDGLKAAVANAGPNDVICVKTNMPGGDGSSAQAPAATPAPTPRVLPPVGAGAPVGSSGAPAATGRPGGGSTGSTGNPAHGPPGDGSGSSGHSAGRSSGGGTAGPAHRSGGASSRSPGHQAGSSRPDADSGGAAPSSSGGASPGSGAAAPSSAPPSSGSAPAGGSSASPPGDGGSSGGLFGGNSGGSGGASSSAVEGGPPGAEAPDQSTCTKQVTDSAGLSQAINSASPGDRICVTGDLGSVRLDIAKGGSDQAPLAIIGNGRTVVKGITVQANNVVVDGFQVLNAQAPGIEIRGNGITVRNNTVKHPTGDDYDGLRFFGNNLRIVHNTISDITNTGGAHADCMQTFTNGEPSSEHVLIDGNRCENIDNQCLMAEGPGDVGDGGGGDGTSADWTWSNNVCQFGASQGVMIEAVQNVTIRNNLFNGKGDKAIGLDIGSTGAKVSANVVGSGIGHEIGMDEKSKQGYQGPQPQGGP